MKIITRFEREELNQMQYPVIVESWDRKMGSFSFKRKYRNEFTENERKLIRNYYNKFYRWHLVVGTPEYHDMKIKTYELLNRAISFFATN